MRFYALVGTVLASEIPLTGLLELARPADATMTIRLGDVPDRISDPAKLGSNWALSQTQLLVRVPGLASFLLAEGRDVSVQFESGRSPVEAAPFLTQTILGLLIQQSGRIVLRASAVETDRGALLFCGEPGAGKSTLAAAMAVRGHRFVADDFCIVDSAPDGSLVVHGDGAQPRLWEDALDALDIQAEAGNAVRDGIRKFHVRLPASAAGSLPLAGIYGLWEDRRLAGHVIEILRGMEAVQMIRDCAYRPHILKPMGAGRAYFRPATAIAQAGEVLSLRRGNGFDWIAEGVQAVSERWHSSSQALDEP